MENIIYRIRLMISICFFVILTGGLIFLFSPLSTINIDFIRFMHNHCWIIVAFLFLILLSGILFGRIFCSLICPFGIFQEIITLFSDNLNEKRTNFPVKYIVAVIFWGIIFTFGIKFIEYLGGVTKLSFLIAITIFLIVIGILAFFKHRIFCTDICPCGTIIGLISKISLFKLYIDKNECLSCGMCERGCPSSCIDSFNEEIENETCVRCLKCLANCPKNAIKFSIKNPNTES